MVAPTVIFIAPQGAGKSVHIEALRARFGCACIVDEWDGQSELPAGALALTNAPVQVIAAAVVP